MADEKKDPRVTRAEGIGLNPEGINTDPDAGQAQVQAKADREEALGYIPSDGANLSVGDTDIEQASVEELAEGQRQANKQYTMPPDGLAAEKPTPPHSAEATSSDSSDASDSGDTPNKSASREEWDEYARSQGVDPEDFSTKEDLQAHFGVS